MSEFAFSHEPNTGNCDEGIYGTKKNNLQYIAYCSTGGAEEDYPEDTCPRYVHGDAQIDNFTVNLELTGKTATFSHCNRTNFQRCCSVGKNYFRIF